MSKYTNNINIPGGRRVLSSEPIDDRLYYSSAADIESDIASDDVLRWYEGMTLLVLDTLEEYVWIRKSLELPAYEELANTSYTYPIGHPYYGIEFSAYKIRLDAAALGLDQVDNTSDADKPISTAQQAALDEKLDFATYDPDRNGIVEYAAQSATNGKNLTSNDIPAFTLITITGAVPGEGALSIDLADADSNLPCFGITAEEIVVGATGRIITVGYAGPVSLPGANVGDLIYLNGLGVPQITAPTTGLVQVVGLVIYTDGGGNAFLGIKPQTSDNYFTFVRDWRAGTPYEKDAILTLDSSQLPRLNSSGFTILLKVEQEGYVSSNNIVTDYNDGKISIVAGDMFQEIYDPTSKAVDAFNADNFDDGANKVIMTTAERTKLAGLEEPNFKGTYQTPELLRAAHPSSQDGHTADVISTSSTWAWNSLGTPTPPEVGGAWENSGVAFGGDMQKSEYDPTSVAGDAFSMTNMAEGPTNKILTDVERTKLSNIEAGAQVNPTAAQIKTDYESNPDTNEFTNSEKTKLSNIENNAEVNRTNAELKTDYESNADTNAFTDAEKSKLANIEAGATARSPITLVFSKENFPALKVKSTDNDNYANFVFPGTNAVGTPTAVKVLHTRRAGDIGICTLELSGVVTEDLPAPTTNEVFQIDTLTGPFTWPATESIININAESSVNNDETWISCIIIYF